ncbi:hypothetical protein RRG08_067078 [Elysia crispata]|uniref:Uncharacterized protein n=1 Tax=Elysia crispata TaxID=231223 RepID=A0AAE1B7Z7_9GAST|nr:hypothetical protein RRG08_067078 [Elysia crispata]
MLGASLLLEYGKTHSPRITDRTASQANLIALEQSKVRNTRRSLAARGLRGANQLASDRTLAPRLVMAGHVGREVA